MEKILLLQILSGTVVIGWINFVVGFFVGKMLEKENQEKREKDDE